MPIGDFRAMDGTTGTRKRCSSGFFPIVIFKTLNGTLIGSEDRVQASGGVLRLSVHDAVVIDMVQVVPVIRSLTLPGTTLPF